MSISDHIFRAIEKHKKKHGRASINQEESATKMPGKHPKGAKGNEHSAKNVDKNDEYEEKGGFGEGLKKPKKREMNY